MQQQQNQKLTSDETDNAKEGMQKIQSPLNPILQNRSHFTNNEVESPIGSC
jgi:hypothetical protein